MKLLHMEIEKCGDCAYYQLDPHNGYGCFELGGWVSEKEIDEQCPLPDMPSGPTAGEGDKR